MECHSFKEDSGMSAPSRRPEIRRRRARSEKISKLRRQYAMSRNDSDRNRLLDKVKKISVGMTREQFLAPVKAAK
jgi:hypothetical protein